MRAFNKNDVVAGKSIYLRAATSADAAFVLAVRSDERKTRYLNPIQGTIADQAAWLEQSYADPYQFYFLISSNAHEPLGLVRLYDQQGDSFCWGSWLIKAGAPSTAAIESALLVYQFALGQGFTQSHFEVRRGNDSVIHFHQNCGAKEVHRTEQEISFQIDEEAIRRFLHKFRKFLPAPG